MPPGCPGHTSVINKKPKQRNRRESKTGALPMKQDSGVSWSARNARVTASRCSDGRSAAARRLRTQAPAPHSDASTPGRGGAVLAAGQVRPHTFWGGGIHVGNGAQVMAFRKACDTGESLGEFSLGRKYCKVSTYNREMSIKRWEETGSSIKRCEEMGSGLWRPHSEVLPAPTLQERASPWTWCHGLSTEMNCRGKPPGFVMADACIESRVCV